jgi:hypothetical protein
MLEDLNPCGRDEPSSRQESRMLAPLAGLDSGDNRV